MKYISDKIKDKVFYVSNGWSGTYTVKEYRNGQFATKLEIVTKRDYDTFIKRMEDNGWYCANR